MNGVIGGQAIPWNEVRKVRLRGDKLSPQGEGAIPEEAEYVPRDEEAAPQEQGSPMDEQSPGYEEHFHAISDESSNKRSSEPSGNDESTSSRQPEGIQTLEARVQQLEELTKDLAEALYGRVLQHVLHLEEEIGPGKDSFFRGKDSFFGETGRFGRILAKRMLISSRDNPNRMKRFILRQEKTTLRGY